MYLDLVFRNHYTGLVFISHFNPSLSFFLHCYSYNKILKFNILVIMGTISISRPRNRLTIFYNYLLVDQEINQKR